MARHISQREGIPAEFCIGDARCLPYHDQSFDKVVCSSSLEHFQNDIEALKEMLAAEWDSCSHCG